MHLMHEFASIRLVKFLYLHLGGAQFFRVRAVHEKPSLKRAGEAG